jgi:hypothetical protein
MRSYTLENWYPAAGIFQDYAVEAGIGAVTKPLPQTLIAASSKPSVFLGQTNLCPHAFITVTLCSGMANRDYPVFHVLNNSACHIPSAVIAPFITSWMGDHAWIPTPNTLRDQVANACQPTDTWLHLEPFRTTEHTEAFGIIFLLVALHVKRLQKSFRHITCRV